MRLGTLAEGYGAGVRHHAAEIDGLVGDSAPRRPGDLHEAGGAQIGIGRMGGIEVFDLGHGGSPGRA